MMSPDLLVIQLGCRRVDGPHADEHTAGAARLAAEAVRFLNHATGTHSPAGLVYPSTVYSVAADLSSAVAGMRQLFGQLARWLADQEAAGRLGTDDRSPVASTVAAASVHLTFASTAARTLSARLDAFQNSISGLNGRGPDRPGSAL